MRAQTAYPPVSGDKLELDCQHPKYYMDDIESEQRMVRMIGAAFPDEATRRQPGFDLRKWQQRQPGYRELLARRTKRRRKAAAP